MPRPETPKWMTTNLAKGRLYDPFQHAEDLGIQVLFRPIETANEMWLPDYETIVIRESMRATHKRTACTHGLAHAILGHRDDRPKHEAQADRYAAELLIHADELAEMLKWAPDPAHLALELGVTMRLLRVYLEIHRLTE